MGIVISSINWKSGTKILPLITRGKVKKLALLEAEGINQQTGRYDTSDGKKLDRNRKSLGYCWTAL